MTHSELVERAAKWLKNSAVYPTETTQYTIDSEGFPVDGQTVMKPRKVKCYPVLAEIGTATAETPDAIGWFISGSFSILIECKTTVFDFYADKQKTFRRMPDKGVGDYRYFMTTKGLLAGRKLPPDWGVLEVCGRVVRVTHQPKRQPKNHTAEATMLCSTIRRLQTVSDDYKKPIR